MHRETQDLQLSSTGKDSLAPLLRGEAGVWLRPPSLGLAADKFPLEPDEVAAAEARLFRFRPVLRALFPAGDWHGHIQSPLLNYPKPHSSFPTLLVKADHSLPMTGSVKARGGVYELLCHIEDVAIEKGLWRPGQSMERLLLEESRLALRNRRVVVASTGNLGFSIGLVARAFGLQAEIHMSHDAKTWKKERLTAIGAQVLEHACDYTETVARARHSAERHDAYFIDDENSRRLFIGYATAARELAGQLAARGHRISAETPLIVYLPCGVGGAPGGITAGLKALFGEHVLAVFVEPVASACMFAALAGGEGAPVSVYDIGLDNETIADGLAVPIASQLVLGAIGRNIDAAVAVTDASMLEWVRAAWQDAGLRLEPSGAAGFAAIPHFLQAAQSVGLDLVRGTSPVHVVWTTGGSLLPDREFSALLGPAN